MTFSLGLQKAEYSFACVWFRRTANRMQLHQCPHHRSSTLYIHAHAFRLLLQTYLEVILKPRGSLAEIESGTIVNVIFLDIFWHISKESCNNTDNLRVM